MPYSGLSGHQAYTWPTGPGRCCLTFSTTVLTPQSQGVTLTGYYPKCRESAQPEGSQVTGGRNAAHISCPHPIKTCQKLRQGYSEKEAEWGGGYLSQLLA